MNPRAALNLCDTRSPFFKWLSSYSWVLNLKPNKKRNHFCRLDSRTTITTHEAFLSDVTILPSLNKLLIGHTLQHVAFFLSKALQAVAINFIENTVDFRIV